MITTIILRPSGGEEGVMKNSFDFTSALPRARTARRPQSLYSDNYFIENADPGSENIVRQSLCWCSQHIRATPGTPPPRFQLSYDRKNCDKKSHWEFNSRRGQSQPPRSSVTNTPARSPVSDPINRFMSRKILLHNNNPRRQKKVFKIKCKILLMMKRSECVGRRSLGRVLSGEMPVNINTRARRDERPVTGFWQDLTNFYSRHMLRVDTFKR